PECRRVEHELLVADRESCVHVLAALGGGVGVGERDVVHGRRRYHAELVVSKSQFVYERPAQCISTATVRSSARSTGRCAARSSPATSPPAHACQRRASSPPSCASPARPCSSPSSSSRTKDTSPDARDRARTCRA